MFPVGTHILNIFKEGEILEAKRSLESGSSERFRLFAWNKWRESLKDNYNVVVHFNEQTIKRPTKWDVESQSTTVGNWESHFSLDVSKHYVVFDRHGSGIDIFIDHGSKQRKTHTAFYEPLHQTQPIVNILQNLPDDIYSAETRNRLALELMEAGLTKVIVLDERIQGFMKRKDMFLRREYTLGQIFDWMNIFVPPKEDPNISYGAVSIDLDNPRKIAEELRVWLKQYTQGAGFLVVHLGVLEKLLENDERKIESWIEEYEAKTDVVLTSGRGIPPLVRRLGKRFIHYSQISRYLVEERSKFHFNKVLHSARRPL